MGLWLGLQPVRLLVVTSRLLHVNMATCEFFCVVNQTTFRELRNGRFPPNLVKKRISVPHRRIRKAIVKNFHFRGHLPQKSEIENRSNRHLTQSRLQITGCTAERYCLLHVVVQGPGIWSTFLYDVYDFGATGRQSCQIFEFLPIFPIQNP